MNIKKEDRMKKNDNRDLFEKLNEAYSKIEECTNNDNSYIVPEPIRSIVDMIDYLKRQESWEAKMLETDECWEDSLPKLNQELYDEAIDLQSIRNSILHKLDLLIESELGEKEDS